MILSDATIRWRLSLPDADPRALRIDPFASATREPGKVSWGLSSAGYDIRLGRNFVLFPADTSAIIEPASLANLVEQDWHEDAWDFGHRVRHQDVDYLDMPPHSFALAETMEVFRIPDDVIGIVLGKSTPARCAQLLNTTPLEPGWRGCITLELANLSGCILRVHAGQGIGQVLFLQIDQIPSVTYAGKAGAKYQGQTGLTLPRV